MTPSACTSVDLYWEHEGDVKFVQVQARAFAPEREPGMYARRAPTGYVNVVVVVSEQEISSRVVARALGVASEVQLREESA